MIFLRDVNITQGLIGEIFLSNFDVERAKKILV